MNPNVPISEIMTRNLVTGNVTDNLSHINALLKNNNIRHLPIISDDKLVGIISKTDILRLSFGDIYEGQSNADESMFTMLSTEQVMVNNPQTVEVTNTIKEVAELMSKVEFHALPVLENDKIVGIISTTDLIRYLLTQFR